MVRVIVGKKGSGKTKKLIDQVNAASSIASGNVVFVSDNTEKNMYDIQSKVRMINASEFSINSYDKLYGFVSGIISGNFDITDIFIDRILPMVDYNVDGLESFIESVEKIAATNKTSIIMSLSIDESELSESIKKYL